MKNPKSLKYFFITLCIAMLSLNSFAQEGQGGGATEADVLEDSIDDLLLVAYCGLGGAVLGLSTLSFVDEPGEHLNNVLVGGAIGIIAGVGLVAYKQAVTTNENYEQEGAEVTSIDFSTSQRRRWAETSHKAILAKRPIPQVGWAFSF